MLCYKDMSCCSASYKEAEKPCICTECDSVVSIRDNYCSDCGQALSFDFKEGH